MIAAAVTAGLFALGAVSGQSAAASSAVAADEAAAPPTVDRIAGADRYEAAVNISKQSHPGEEGLVYLVTGQNYPDALSAAPAVVHQGKGPLLLTPGDALPPIVAQELQRLNPSLVVIVGGVNSVSKKVEDAVKALPVAREEGIQVTRIDGVDRYAASRNLINWSFGMATQGDFTYVATGATFPDALSAGAAAGAADVPVLLVDGTQPSLDATTEGFISLRDVVADSVKIAGGPVSVSPGIETQIAAITPVERLFGPDRYAASVAINHEAFNTSADAHSDRAFLATGENFPDALAGAAYAGAIKAPLFVVPGTCVPNGVLTELAELDVKRVTLLGGPNSLSPAVEALTPCGAPE
ncbi:MAG: cell wall-binding repeat-containing protein [Herbiconiux sp.]|nr:cell wall-binding repeat-containing protein [Herbiconiux sp.]